MDYSHYEDIDSTVQTNQYSPSSMAEDQRLCIEYMKKHYNIDDQRIGLYGRSLGGRVAMTMANEKTGITLEDKKFGKKRRQSPSLQVG